MSLFRRKRRERYGPCLMCDEGTFYEAMHQIHRAEVSSELHPDQLPLDKFFESATRDEFWDYIQKIDRLQSDVLGNVQDLLKFFREGVKDERMWATKDLLDGARLIDYPQLRYVLDNIREIIIYNHYALENYELLHIPVLYAPPDVLIKDPE